MTEFSSKYIPAKTLTARASGTIVLVDYGTFRVEHQLETENDARNLEALLNDSTAKVRID